MKTALLACVVAGALPLTGCGMFSSPPVRPSDITVEQALASVGDGLAVFKKKLDSNNMQLGMYVETINLELDLTTDQKGDGKLSVDFSKGFQLGPQLGMEQTVDASRGSKLVITLKQAMVPSKQSQETAHGDGASHHAQTPANPHDKTQNGQGDVSEGPSKVPFHVPWKILGQDPKM
ncbi:hypothetical protein E2P84_19675 [Burkholderia cepacia]|uniref:Lipoprotein n=1 Tax=Burkholderia cepacia TaxID=292 RepID=A0AAX2RM72_BURCE|nr:hypothetical protein [Burkholderia cepacia]TES74130.1 hypothetical protein E2P84_19675 [Burkholderia cepacia]TES99876.1 hypothetical protein E3D36_23305 [Burkholderia cepacia]TEU36541.1 hypothetical protein E3D39_27070 [Burkholderia cepacia]TEU43177.1 hypothetical protein E3D37_23935 [Burkholderia cepacia]TEU47459.1 hypothetical protein E3D38_23785 [Burkholderia cepacia]